MSEPVRWMLIDSHRFNFNGNVTNQSEKNAVFQSRLWSQNVKTMQAYLTKN